MAELKLLGRVELEGEATPEEKAGIVSVLANAGLFVYQKGKTIYIRVEADDIKSNIQN